MTLALLVVAALAAVNPVRARGALPAEDTRRVAALGAAVAGAALVPIVALAGPLADALHLSAPTVRMGVGAAVAVVGAAEVLLPLPRPEPALPGRWAALLPVAFPVLLTPALGLLAATGALDRGAVEAAGVLGLALATVPAVALLAPPGRSAAGDRAAAAVARLLSAGLVAAGIALVMDGVFDI